MCADTSSRRSSADREYDVDRTNSHIGVLDALERTYKASFNVAPTVTESPSSA